MITIENSQLKNVLVIDDEIYVRKIFEYNLIRAGYNVKTAEDTFEAEYLIEAGNEYDLIICDLMMPIRSGLEFVRILREKYEMTTQKIMIVSARGIERDLTEAKKYGIIEFQIKPFKVKDFLEKVEDIFKK